MFRNSNISYEDNLLENGFDSLLLSQASGKIVNEIPEASGLRFDEILRVALVTPMIKMISEYIERKNSESKQKKKWKVMMFQCRHLQHIMLCIY